MLVIYKHDLDLAGYQDLDRLYEEVRQRYGEDLVAHIHPHPEYDQPPETSEDIVAVVDDATPAEDIEFLREIVAVGTVNDQV
ncbi:hypothetical protein D3C87_645890 [compost metagenome]